MKIAIFSDLQGFSYDSWIKLFELGLPEEVKCIITLGDIETLELSKLKERFSEVITWLGVQGNHDDRGDLEHLNIENMHMQVNNIQGIRFGGFEGSNRYKKGDYPMWLQLEAFAQLNQLESCDVLLSHNSPKGVHDKDDIAHEGFTGLLHYIEKYMPRYCFHGHQHINKETLIGKTKVISVYGGWVFDLETGGKQEVLRILD